MTIFAEVARTKLDSKRHSETLVDYLDRSARPEMSAMRDVWETWFARYPHEPATASDEGAELRKALRGRLRSRRERQQVEAFWELYLHESLVRAGGRVVVRSDTPDFDVFVGAGHFQVEATVRGESDDETAAGNRGAALRDGLDRVATGPWYLEVSADIETTSPPPIAALRAQIERWLRSLDVAAARAAHLANGAGGFERDPSRTFEVQGYAIHVGAHPKREGAATDARRGAIGIWGGAVVQVDKAEPLLASLERKASALRRGSAPIVLAVLLDRDFADDDHVEAALFGAEQIEVRLDGASRTPIAAHAARVDDGFWSRSGRGTQIDAVLAAVKWDPARIARATPTLWINPERRRERWELPARLPWRQCWTDDRGRVRRVQGPSPVEFFGLAASWPE